MPQWDHDDLIERPGFSGWNRSALAYNLMLIPVAFAGFFAKWIGITFLVSGLGGMLVPILILVHAFLPIWTIQRRYRKLGYPTLSLAAAGYIFYRTGFAFKRLRPYEEFRGSASYPNTVLGSVAFIEDVHRTGGPVHGQPTAAPPDEVSHLAWREVDLGASPGLLRLHPHAIIGFLIMIVGAIAPIYPLVRFAGTGFIPFAFAGPFMIHAVIWLPALWARSVLKSKGYPSLSLVGGMRAFVYMGCTVKRAPLYEDFTLIPGYRNSINGLIEVMRGR